MMRYSRAARAAALGALLSVAAGCAHAPGSAHWSHSHAEREIEADSAGCRAAARLAAVRERGASSHTPAEQQVFEVALRAHFIRCMQAEGWSRSRS